SFLHELLYSAIHAVGHPELTLRADGDEVRFAELADAVAGLANDREHFALEIELQHLTREAVHHEDRVLTDVEAARQSCELHLTDERALVVEDLNALVLAIGHPEQPLCVDRDPVRDFELARLLALAAPRRDELPRLVELEHAGIAFRARRVPLHDEHIAVARD